MASSDRLSWRQRIGYGVGDYGLVLCWQLAGIFLLYFLTEILEIPPATAGALVLVGLIFDGVTDIMMGLLADRLRRRFSGYRPWLLIGAPLLAVTTAFLFYVPQLEGWELMAAALGAQLAFRLAYTIVAIPYGTLSSAMTQDSRERSLLVGIRLTLSTSAAMTVALAVQPLVSTLGAGDEARGFFLAAAAIGSVSALMILVAWATSREQPASDASANTYSASQLLSHVLANGPFLRVAACIAFFALYQAFVITGAPYYFTHVRGEAETLGLSLAALIGGVALFIPVWTFISRVIGKRATWIVGAVWSSASLVGLSLLADAPQSTLLGAFGIAAFGFAAVTLTSFSMLPDTVEYGEWKTGVRVEAALYSALTLSQKAAAGIAASALGLLLSFVGHSPQNPMTGESAALFGQVLFVTPAIIILMSLVPVWGYPISTAFHAKLLETLRERGRVS